MGWVAAFAIAAGCSSSSSDSSTGANLQGKNVEIYSWWTGVGEKDALAALVSDFETKTGATVINTTVVTAGDARTELQNRIVQGNPPDAFQANAGAAVFTWVKYNGVDDSQTKLESLDFLDATEHYTTVVPKAIIDEITFNGHLYAIPSDVHRINALFYNPKVLQANGIAPPTTMDDLIASCDTLAKAGVACLAMAKQGWELEIVVKALMLEAAGSDAARYYKDFVGGNNAYFSGKTATEDATMLKVLDRLGQLAKYKNGDYATSDWQPCAESVKTGTAAYYIHGDWVHGYMHAKGYELGTDYQATVVPGTDGKFIYTVDVFALPKGAKDRDGAIAWLKELGSVEGQEIFNPIKGSVPARGDADPNKLDAYAQETYAQFRSATVDLLPDFSLSVPQAFGDAFDAALLTFVDDGNVENFLKAVQTNYPKLQQ